MQEVNFDCLAGPTHYFGGLSLGNLASAKNKEKRSNPKKAALQGLLKMKKLADQGFMQAILPPHPRPHFAFLRNLGFRGSEEKILKDAFNEDYQAFMASLSSSFMWAANMASFSPSIDCRDHKAHITPANLSTMLHRNLEAEQSYNILKQIFFNKDYFTVHEPIFSHNNYSDEGAANHNRLYEDKNFTGLEIFIYNKDSNNQHKSKIYPSRQALLSQAAIARNHQIKDFLYIEQNPIAIDSGAFHNDVVCVMNNNLMLCHEYAFLLQNYALDLIEKKYQELFSKKPIIIEIKNNLLPLKDAVSSYLFNSQLLSKKDGTMVLFSPKEAKENIPAQKAIDWILAGDNPIDEVQFFDVTESMDNGGGPACLRLRVLLNKIEMDNIKKAVFFNHKIFAELNYIINKFYEEEFYLEKIFDKDFLKKTKDAYDSIYQILGFSL